MTLITLICNFDKFTKRKNLPGRTNSGNPKTIKNSL